MNSRLAIEDVSPVVDLANARAKAVVDERLPVSATVWREGHGALGAAVLWSGPDGALSEVPMSVLEADSDRWTADVVADRTGEWTFRIMAWADPWASWLGAVEARVRDGQELAPVDREDGAALLYRAADVLTDTLTGTDAAGPLPGARVLRGADTLYAAAAALRAARTTDAALAALSGPVRDVMAGAPLREALTLGRGHRVRVERHRALFGSWYEFFPRSTGGRDLDGVPVHGTFRTAARELPRIARMGFDIVYLPPIHPIGEVARKGPNNALTAQPHDVGSPWAVGSRSGGHDAVHPQLGTLADFDAFVAAAADAGLEVALDLALQCAPDHPWVDAHPEWFTHRSDGSIACAENPPKMYEDIFPLDFDSDPEGLFAEVVRTVLFWAGRGVRAFRVDNPHTKPPGFWHRLIETLQRTDPDLLFLAEAFTRATVQHGLSKRGFSQTYTYFTWCDTQRELTDYLTELTGDAAAWMRPNFFVNTPDILPDSLRDAPPAAFALRAALAATLSPSWGMYAGFELYENQALEPGSEEYLDSEKYELRPRDFAAHRSLEPWIGTLNRLRRAHPALQQLRHLHFHPVDNDQILAYSKSDPVTGDTVLCVVTLNPLRTEQATVRLDMSALGRDPTARIRATEEITGQTVELGPALDIKVDPQQSVAHVFTWRVR
ncbi:DUF3416 domain-containing protein (plasmid) [Streptomyces sp. NBC_00464]|uniref:maltotransferase domain-containing protein n=1 Tax=Streptomyces sp. NBC_00464 TaxID=2975751 RepID=UPI002E1848F2